MKKDYNMGIGSYILVYI